MKPVRLKSLIAIAVTSLFLVSVFQILISGSALAAAAEAEPKTFVYGSLEPVMSANPYVGENDIDYLLYGFTYDGLLSPGADGETRPNLVSSWWLLDGNATATQPIPTDFVSLMGSSTQNDDPAEWPKGSIWEYNLTEDVFWSDGHPFDADDVVFTIKMQIGASYETFWSCQPYTFWILDVQKVDDHKVRVFFADHVTKAPVPVAWGYSMTMPILPEHILGTMSPAQIAFDWDGTPSVGLGPFNATDSLGPDVISGESVTLVRNPYYNFTDPADGKQKGLGYVWNRSTEIDKIILKFYSNESAMSLDVENGNVDVCSLNTNGYLALKAKATEANRLKVQEALPCTTYSYILHWNVYKNAPLDLNPARLDPAFLRATAIATNQSNIIDQLWNGGGLEGTGLITPVYPEWYWTPGDEPSTFNVTNGLNESDPNFEIIYSYTKPMKDVMDFDKEIANEILDAAGYVWNAGHTMREIGPVAAERLKNMSFITDAAAVIGDDLSFFLLTTGYADDIAIADYLTWEWFESVDNIGVKMDMLLVNDATWSTMVYTYSFDYTITYWFGDDDPNYLLFVPTSYTIGHFNEFGTEDPYYDHLYDMQAKTLNETERKVWIDKCQEWQYLSGSAVYMYPKFGWAMNEQRWTNWGNFTEHPGLAPCHFWSEPPWVFQIKWGSPPTTTVGLVGTLGSNGWYISNVTVTLTATDNVGGSGVNATVYRIGTSGSWLNYSSPFILSSDGISTIQFYSIDNMSNTESAKSIPVKIDKTIPTLTINQTAGFKSTVDYVVISWISSDAASGISYIEVSIDGAAFAAVGLEMSHNFSGLADGAHNVTVKAIDGAGNEVNKTIQFTVNVSEGGGGIDLFGLVMVILIIAIIAAIGIPAILGMKRRAKESDSKSAIKDIGTSIAQMEDDAPKDPGKK